MRLYTNDDQPEGQSKEDNYFLMLLGFLFLGFLVYLVFNVIPL